MESEVLKTKINSFSVGLFLIGMVTFGYFAYTVLVSPMKSENDFNEKDLMVLKWIIFAAFMLIFSVCSYLFFSAKILLLTNQNIIIDYPFLSIKKTIPISSIKKVVERNNVYMYSRLRYDNYIFKEKETIIEFIDGKKIKVDLSKAENYAEFKKRLTDIIIMNDTTANSV